MMKKGGENSALPVFKPKRDYLIALIVFTTDWLPPTCAYRLVADGRDLYWWHPLISGTFDSVHVANASAKNKTRPEGRLKTPGLMKRIIKWPEPLEKPPKGWRRAKSSPRRGGADD